MENIQYLIEADPDLGEQIAALFGPDLETREKVRCKDGELRNFYVVSHEFLDRKLRGNHFAQKRYRVFVSKDKDSPEPMSILNFPRTRTRSSGAVRKIKRKMSFGRQRGPVKGAYDEEEGEHPRRRR